MFPMSQCSSDFAVLLWFTVLFICSTGQLCSVYSFLLPSSPNTHETKPSFNVALKGSSKDINFSDRRDFLLAGGASVALVGIMPPHSSAVDLTKSGSATNTTSSRDMSWPLGKVAFSLLPLSGGTRRATVEETIVKDQIWTYDQIQGIINVNVPVRQTVVRLSESSGGGLFVLNPVAPTNQLLKMMRNLERQYGPVRHIVLGTVALEHKATFGPFAQNFPNAQVWIQPGQWSFPLNLPLAPALGVLQRGSRLLSQQDPPEWVADLDYEILEPLRFKSIGAFSETAFFHKPSQTLLVTDAVVSITADPPPIIQEDPSALLFHARDSIADVVQDTPDIRRKGWRRMVQFGLFFFPSQIDVVPFDKAIAESFKYGTSLYPWTWHNKDADQQNFDVLSNNGKLFCPPILTKLIFDREPQRVLQWVDAITKRFDFIRIVPGHLANNIASNPKEFKEAFRVLEGDNQRPQPQRPLAEDLALLQKASDLLTRLNIVDASQVCDGEPARTVGRFRSKL